MVFVELVFETEPCNAIYIKTPRGRYSLASAIPQSGRSWGVDDASRHPPVESLRGGAFARRHVNAIAIDAGDRFDASRVREFDEFRDFRVESHYTDTHGPLNALCRLRGGGGRGRSRYPWTDSRRRPLNSRRVGSYRMRVSERQCAHARAVMRGMPPACFVSCPDLPSRRTRRIHN